MEVIRKDPGRPVLKQNRENGIEYLTFPGLEACGAAQHMFSTRICGVSEGIYASMNLSFTRGDDPLAVRENFARTARLFHTDLSAFVCSDQTHTANVRAVTANDRGRGVVRPKGYTDVDGLVTDVPGLILSTFYADCVPLLFVDPVRKAIGCSHSGWRGTVQEMGRARGRPWGGITACGRKINGAGGGPSSCGDA